MPNISWLQLLKCSDLFYSLLHHCKLNALDWSYKKKEATFGTPEVINRHFHNASTFYMTENGLKMIWSRNFNHFMLANSVNSPWCFNVISEVSPSHKIFSISLDDRQLPGLFVNNSGSYFSLHRSTRQTQTGQNCQNIYKRWKTSDSKHLVSPWRHVCMKKSHDNAGEWDGTFKIKEQIRLLCF